jgi:hypothetical protein
MKSGIHQQSPITLLSLTGILAPSLFLFVPHRIGAALRPPAVLIEDWRRETVNESGKQPLGDGSNTTASGRKLLPVDEASKDPSFKAFRDALIEAVNQKDTQAILNSVAPDIQNDFGGGNGIENFKSTWRLGRASESKLWAELGTILSMGGSFIAADGKKQFWAPYVYSAWPENFDCGEDSQCYAVIGENVNVRREPSSSAAIAASLSYDIVKVKIEDPAASKAPEGWTRVTIPGGGTGYVATRYIRSPSNYRAGFSKVKGKWLMIAFLGGD